MKPAHLRPADALKQFFVAIQLGFVPVSPAACRLRVRCSQTLPSATPRFTLWPTSSSRFFGSPLSALLFPAEGSFSVPPETAFGSPEPSKGGWPEDKSAFDDFRDRLPIMTRSSDRLTAIPNRAHRFLGCRCPEPPAASCPVLGHPRESQSRGLGTSQAFLWLNPTRMHVFTHLSDKYESMRTLENGWTIEEAGMA